MATPGQPGKYDWSEPTPPAGLANRVTDHRRLARTLLIIVDIGLLGLVLAGLNSSGRYWPSFLVLAAWLVLTAFVGWMLPKQVDAWRREHDLT